MKEDIEQAIERLRSNAGRYGRYEQYYRGAHRLSFATEKFENVFGAQFRAFAMNLCPAVCDAVKDKLTITGFVPADGRPDPERLTEKIWDRNLMCLRSGEVHKEVLKNGDAYVIAWADAEGRALLHPNRAADVAVFYDEERPGRVIKAAKSWRSADGHTRLNLYFPDRIEKYVTAKANGSWLPDPADFVPDTSARTPRGGRSNTVPNPYGIVPVFHFSNNADIGQSGRSELEDAIPIQDGLNKSVLDMLVAMEFSAYRQRWAAGIELEYDLEGKPVAPFRSGVEHLWIAQDPNSKFGDFEAAQLDQFLKVKDSFRIDIASVTGTPLHYLMPHMRGQPSGETLRRSETRFLAKVRDRQNAFGQVWARVMEFALAIEGNSDGILLRTEWEDPSPMTERERLENVLLKRQVGLPVERAAGSGL
ncbi:MAG: phage portal protein [Pyrinomonadaceae bacterium]